MQLVTDCVEYQRNILDGDGVMGSNDTSQDMDLVVSPNITTSYQCTATLISGDDVMMSRFQIITINIPGMHVRGLKGSDTMEVHNDI